MVSVDGMNWLRVTGYFLNPPGISLCSPRNTVNVLVAEDDAWAPPAMERMAKPTQRIRARLKLKPPKVDYRWIARAPTGRDARTIALPSEVVQNSPVDRRSDIPALSEGTRPCPSLCPRQGVVPAAEILHLSRLSSIRGSSNLRLRRDREPSEASLDRTAEVLAPAAKAAVSARSSAEARSIAAFF